MVESPNLNSNTKKGEIMPTDDPGTIEARNLRVKIWNLEQSVLKRMREETLISRQEAVISFLKGSKIDSIIRQIFSEVSPSFLATKIKINEIPMDGKITAKHPPAFVLDQYWQTGIPGIHYFFRSGLDETSLRVTLCISESGKIFPFFHLTYEDGRFHTIRWQVSFSNPSDEQLSHWLREQLQVVPQNSP